MEQRRQKLTDRGASLPALAANKHYKKNNFLGLTEDNDR